MRAPEGASFEYTQHEMDQHRASTCGDEVPEIARAFAIAAPGSGGGAVNTGLFNLYLTRSRASATRTQEEIFQQLVDAISSASPACARSRPSRRRSATAAPGQPVQYVLQAPTLEELVAVLPEFLEAASASPVLRFVDADLKVNRPEGCDLDRSRSAPPSSASRCSTSRARSSSPTAASASATSCSTTGSTT